MQAPLVLSEFIRQIDISGQSFTNSLRTFLSTFKLPGEAQKIDRLAEGFGSAYNAQNTGNVASGDAAYFLAFATIMLNTDRYNASIPEAKKMTCEQFIRNVRGGNKADKDSPEIDFNKELLEQIFVDINKKQFELNFIKIAPGYEINSKQLFKDTVYKKLDQLLESDQKASAVFSVSNNVRATVDKPKSWLNSLTGYEGTLTLRDDVTKAAVSVQVYTPGFFSKWFLGEQPKIIIQPLNEKGCNPQATIDLAAKVAASFDTPVTHTKATYDYEKADLETAYKANKQTFQVEVARAIAVSYKDTVKLLDDAPRSGDTPTM